MSEEYDGRVDDLKNALSTAEAELAKARETNNGLLRTVSMAQGIAAIHAGNEHPDPAQDAAIKRDALEEIERTLRDSIAGTGPLFYEEAQLRSDRERARKVAEAAITARMRRLIAEDLGPFSERGCVAQITADECEDALDAALDEYRPGWREK